MSFSRSKKMKAKGKSLIVKPSMWKSVSMEPLNDGSGDVDDLDALVSIEELTDYNVSNELCDTGIKRKRKRGKCDDYDDGNVIKDDSGRNRDSDRESGKAINSVSKKKKKMKKKKDAGRKEKKEKEEIVENKEQKNKGVIASEDSVKVSSIGSSHEKKKKDISEARHIPSAWDNLLIPESVIRALQELNFDSPTPIQALAIPAAIRDRLDIIGAAETGSGKTLAFAIPLIDFILNEKEAERNANLLNKGEIERKIRALVLTPTRELAVQIKKHIESVTVYCDVRVGVVVGGMSVQKQERILRKQCPDILVATPGRLWELIESDNEHLNVRVIKQLSKFVIDEADRMTEKGHFEELKRITDLLKESHVKARQIFVFSATLTLIHELPKRVRLKNKKGKNKQQGNGNRNKISQSEKLRALIEMIGMREKHTKVIDLTREGIGIPSQQMLTETKINCLNEQKDLYLYYFLTLYHGRTLIFCNSKDCLRRLQNVLKLLQVNPLVLHASIPQKRRLTNLERFESNPKGVLIASDVAARGLDIPRVDHVIHYQIPRTAEIYIHRSGRTARAYNEGLSLMLCDPKEETFFYRKLCMTMNKGNDLQLFPIDESILKIMKQRVDLAQKCDQLDHKVRKSKANKDWFHHAANQCDIEIDETDIIGRNSLLTQTESQQETRQLKNIQLQLNALLKKPIMSRNHIINPFVHNNKNDCNKTGKSALFKGQTALGAVKESKR